jgi:hypothetical protein
MKRIVITALASLALYSALLVVEEMRTDEPFDALSLAVDIVEMLLLASAVLLTDS